MTPEQFDKFPEMVRKEYTRIGNERFGSLDDVHLIHSFETGFKEGALWAERYIDSLNATGSDTSKS